MRIGVTGGRYFADKQRVASTLALLAEWATLVHGGARGADDLCATWWEYRSPGQTEAHYADWDKHGKAAGHIRNQQMVDSGLDLLVAFPGGRGTADMVSRAEKAGIPILRVP